MDTRPTLRTETQTFGDVSRVVNHNDPLCRVVTHPYCDGDEHGCNFRGNPDEWLPDVDGTYSNHGYDLGQQIRTLRRAADHIEAVATAAGHGNALVFRDDNAGWVQVDLPNNVRPTYDVQHIALWSPAMALLVAQLLRASAEEAEYFCRNPHLGIELYLTEELKLAQAVLNIGGYK